MKCSDMLKWIATCYLVIALAESLVFVALAQQQRVPPKGCCYTNCPDVEGYVFMPGHLPARKGYYVSNVLSKTRAPSHGEDGSVYLFYTLFGGCNGYKYPDPVLQADVANTAGQCQSNIACLAFSTSGLLYSAITYDGEKFSWGWEQVPQCFSSSCSAKDLGCVGTYVVNTPGKASAGSGGLQARPKDVKWDPDDCVCKKGENGGMTEVCSSGSALTYLKKFHRGSSKRKPKVSYKATGPKPCGALC
jgi:hypothetical protein